MQVSIYFNFLILPPLPPALLPMFSNPHPLSSSSIPSDFQRLMPIRHAIGSKISVSVLKTLFNSRHTISYQRHSASPFSDLDTKHTFFLQVGCHRQLQPSKPSLNLSHPNPPSLTLIFIPGSQYHIVYIITFFLFNPS